jgi:DNA repair exonuclease SbcCD ATPase subunit
MVPPLMSKRDKPQESTLVTAARSLDEGLERFEALAQQLQDAPLQAEKHLEKASATLKALADMDEELRARVAGLVGAISQVRDRQQTQAEAVQARAMELQQRTEIFKDLLVRYGSLGQSAGELNVRMQEFAAQRQQAKTPEENAALATSFQSLQDRMGEVADEAQSLSQAAEEKDFNDISRQAESLRQQLMSARNKLSLLQKSFGG